VSAGVGSQAASFRRRAGDRARAKGRAPEAAACGWLRDAPAPPLPCACGAPFGPPEPPPTIGRLLDNAQQPHLKGSLPRKGP
jgi:hypothetical protein